MIATTSIGGGREAGATDHEEEVPAGLRHDFVSALAVALLPGHRTGEGHLGSAARHWRGAECRHT
jgi:hypothetical protein